VTSSAPSFVAALLAVVLAGPVCLAGQVDHRLRVDSARATYERAKSLHTDALAGYMDSLDRWDVLFQQLQLARASGNEELITERLQQTLAPGRDKSANLILVQEAQDLLTLQREELIGLLIDWGNEVDRDLQEVREGTTVWLGYRALLDTISSEIGELLDVPTDPVPELTIEMDPRDGEEELRAKVELCMTLADLAETAVAEIDQLIGQLQVQLRMERQRRDLRTDRDRFGDASVAIGPPPAGTREVVSQDTTTGDGLPATTEERIILYQEHRERVIKYRESLIERAAEFMELIGGRER